MALPRIHHGPDSIFEMELTNIGRIRCEWHDTVGALCDVENLLKIHASDSSAFVRDLLGLACKKIVDSKAESLALSVEQLRSISIEDLEKFSAKFMAENGRFLQHHPIKTDQGEGIAATEAPENDQACPEAENSAPARLMNLFEAYHQARLASFKATLENVFPKGVFSSATSALLESNARLSESLKQTLQAAQIPQAELSQLGRALATSVTFPPKEALKIQVEPRSFVLPDLPENPIYETNRRINEVVTALVAVQKVIMNSTALTTNLNDVAISMAKDLALTSKEVAANAKSSSFWSYVMAILAIIGIAVSAWFSYLSYSNDTLQNEANQRFLERIEESLLSDRSVQTDAIRQFTQIIEITVDKAIDCFVTLLRAPEPTKAKKTNSAQKKTK